MKIVADENLAFTDYFFAEFGEIQNLAGRSISNNDLKDCDALLVRSVTKVNEQLIKNTPIKFVGSATIGTDHLDISALDSHHVPWANAAGCNAQAVAEYVVTALLTLRPELIDAGQSFCLGVVGLGNVGTRLVALAQFLDWRVIGYDPFVAHASVEQVDFSTLLSQSDAISIHVPLTKKTDVTAEHATHHLFNENALNQMKTDAILINSARGSVVKEQALLADIAKNNRQVVLDVFEHEPQISAELLNALAIATPHIAGYSLEGKARGTQMIYQAFCKTFDKSADKDFVPLLDRCEPLLAQEQDAENAKAEFKTQLMQNVSTIYDIRRDDQALRACLNDGVIQQKAFDDLRKNYPLRREWSAFGAELS
ncbi:erythronate-4-phosphate dehydrogenase [Acinetobacter marinus]|uniref:Erythronate-4-phosphate dehydrogenase n=1 Tax=Acinetobacter marinus TaxID=281375 RepID=A0A1G6GTQ8_9GAMM|nr:4-phosphoerythronate dehydrogenase [Acinetobacter marinus]SDB84516.1 erythronate-4-phosphate dehydrogenase [Acinetobacter marinus]